MRTMNVSLCCAALLSGCETVPTEPSPSGLGQTEWTLIDVRSPPGAEPAEVPVNRYTMSLKGNRTAGFKLDCNSGSGSWRAVPSAPAKGTVTFGPIVSTMMACSDSGVAERLGRDLAGSWPY